MSDVQGTNRETPGIRARNHWKHLLDIFTGRNRVIPSPVRQAEMEQEGLVERDTGSGEHRATLKGRRRINPRGD